MTDGDLSALLTILAIPVGGLIAWGILWLLLRQDDAALKADSQAAEKA